MPRPRPNRRSKLDPFKEQIKQWMQEDHCYNCEAMLPRLLDMGYTGSLSVLKAFVHPLRPPQAGHAPVQRFETGPGEQVQFDWGEFKYEQDGVPRKIYGFTAILCYSRMRFVTFVKRCDGPTLIRCLMEAFEYFGGLPKAALTDRMKSVLLVEMEGKIPRWNPRFADFMASIGVAPRVCRAYTPQTKGIEERYMHEQGLRVLETLDRVAAAYSAIASATSVEQVHELIDAVEVSLREDNIQALNRASTGR